MSSLSKRSVALAGHATSVALEPEFWTVLDRIAAARCLSKAQLLAEIDAGRGRRPLASACRLLALDWVADHGRPA
ncbi:putative DNA-binding ribbon-helix-helix protein [Brevundimonas vesicularis]|uniref:ribbon-helix-helix domain-containing protein n=1 Tax=Brevundimonas vesicularis TaxID=41276 RepID=UPI002780F817|nr:ribbon-helix-helix domain-containing protein [Brevundimonas vesicularis]MDQ1192863.1 putative DNA-binding ribbon-helix-helix protein [Brevundimonas vesicularis]